MEWITKQTAVKDLHPNHDGSKTVPRKAEYKVFLDKSN